MEPVFNEISNKVDISMPLTHFVNDVSQIINIEEKVIIKAYDATCKGFEKLEETDFIVKRGSDMYPRLLEQTHESPPFLFMRGNPQLLAGKIVSVVGTRHPSEDGKNKAYKLSKLLGDYHIIVASGLAMGIDTVAHTAALENNNLTIAVIGTPITKVYPKENEKLQKIIAERGLVISQFSPSAPVQRWYFPVRNGVMSGISLATVIIEAGETSGALKQADYALKQGRLVFIPQSALDNPNITWPKKYITKQGAAKFSKIDELLSQLEKSFVIEKHDENQQLSLFSEGIEAKHVYRSK
jgi:DNA processing protein